MQSPCTPLPVHKNQIIPTRYHAPCWQASQDRGGRLRRGARKGGVPPSPLQARHEITKRPRKKSLICSMRPGPPQYYNRVRFKPGSPLFPPPRNGGPAFSCPWRPDFAKKVTFWGCAVRPDALTWHARPGDCCPTARVLGPPLIWPGLSSLDRAWLYCGLAPPVSPWPDGPGAERASDTIPRAAPLSPMFTGAAFCLPLPIRVRGRSEILEVRRGSSRKTTPFGGYVPAAAPLGFAPQSTAHLRRRVAMARKKPDVWGCEHPMPIEVVYLGEGRRAKCLTCGQCGSVRPDAEGALRALQDTASRREEIGA